MLVYSLCFSHGFPGCSEKTKLTAANGGVRSRGLVSRVNRNEQTDWCLLAGTIFFTSAQGMYQNIFAYYSTTRVNRKIWVNGSLFDDWYNLYEFCTSRVSNWNLHTRLHTYKLISLEAPHSAEQVFFIDSYFVWEMRVPTDDWIFEIVNSTAANTGFYDTKKLPGLCVR